MKQKLIISLWLRVCMLVAVMSAAFTGSAWGIVVSGTTYETKVTNSLPEGWSGNGTGGSYIQLTSSTNYIQTSSFSQNGFTSIKVKARKYGGPSDAQALITVSWYDKDTSDETVLGTVAPTSTSLSDYTISSPTNPTGNTSGYVKIQCKGAGNSKGSGVSEVTITYTAGSGGETPATYTVAYDSNGGSGSMTDDDSPYDADATVTVLGNEFTRDGYTFTEWNTAADGSGTAYNEDDTFPITANTTLYAQWEENAVAGAKKLTFNLSSNPGGWPTTNSTTLTNYTYTLNDVDYTFALNNVKCNSGYLMMTATAVFGLPVIAGYKLTKVEATNTSNCSTSTKVGISNSSSSASYISGGSIQTWSTRSSTYTYTLSSTAENTMYYMYVTNANAQVISLDLTYEKVELTYTVTYDANEASSGIVPTDANIYNDESNIVTVKIEGDLP